MLLSVFSVSLLSDNLLLLASLLVFFALLVSKVGYRFGVPSLLLFLLVGMVAGPDGVGLHFENYEIAEFIGHFAMTVILLTSGLETDMKETRPVIGQGVLLSTLGVLLTAFLTGGFIYFFAARMLGGLWATAAGCLTVAVVMSSTDSASVFSILRSRQMHLKHNLGPMLELESGSNDSMAYIMTIFMVNLLKFSQENGDATPFALTGILLLLLQIVVGFMVGVGIGFASKWLLSHVSLSASPLYAIMILSIGIFTNAVASLLHGNGLLALYVTAIIIGNYTKIPYKKDIHKFMDGITWLVQLLMFLMLGLLIRPTELPSVVVPALMIALFMIFVARPLSVFLCLLPYHRLPLRAKAMVSWVGLKGAGPILFAMCPLLAGLPGSMEIFNIVFVVTLLSQLLQGMSLPAMARLLKLDDVEMGKAETYGIEIPEEIGMMTDHVVTEEDLQLGETLRELRLPHGIRVIMVRRGDAFLSPHGSMRLKVGDHLVILLCKNTDD